MLDPWLGPVEPALSLGLPLTIGIKARMATALDHLLLLCGAVLGGWAPTPPGDFGHTREPILAIFRKSLSFSSSFWAQVRPGCFFLFFPLEFSTGSLLVSSHHANLRSLDELYTQTQDLARSYTLYEDLRTDKELLGREQPTVAKDVAVVGLVAPDGGRGFCM